MLAIAEVEVAIDEGKEEEGGLGVDGGVAN